MILCYTLEKKFLQRLLREYKPNSSVENVFTEKKIKIKEVAYAMLLHP